MYKLKTIHREDLVIYHYPNHIVSVRERREKLYNCLSIPETDFPLNDLIFNHHGSHIDVFYSPSNISIEELTFKIMKYGLTK